VEVEEEEHVCSHDLILMVWKEEDELQKRKVGLRGWELMEEEKRRETGVRWVRGCYATEEGISVFYCMLCVESFGSEGAFTVCRSINQKTPKFLLSMFLFFCSFLLLLVRNLLLLSLSSFFAHITM